MENKRIFPIKKADFQRRNRSRPVSNMVLVFLLPLLWWSWSLNAQYCTPDYRFTEVAYFDNQDIATDTNLIYGNAIDYQGNSQNLLLDIWRPSGPNETLTKRPFILLIHGGGFINGDKSVMSVECRRFAQRGYVAATMGYRLGWDDNNPLDGVFAAAYRAQQDAHAALRYIVENANTYGIDTSWMFIGGTSAGAGTSLNTVFVNEAEWISLIPFIASQWGSLNTSGNALTHSFNIKAVYNNCGFTIEVAIDSADMVPIVSFHGYLDNIVPIGSTAGGTAGSSVIHNSLVEKGVCSELTVDSLGAHCPHPRNFRVERAACFFKSVFCHTCTTNYYTDMIPADCSTPIVGATDPDTENQLIRIFPNPFADQFTISGELDLLRIDILNPRGQLIQTISPTGTAHTVDLSTFPSGLYFLKVHHLPLHLHKAYKIIKY